MCVQLSSSIRFGKTERSKEHRYFSYDESIKPGDRVFVWQGWMYVGNVIRVGYYTADDAPYPILDTWMIEKTAYDRVDFMKYPESESLITEDNLYKNHYLSSDNIHRQYLARSDIEYEFVKSDFDRYLKKDSDITLYAVNELIHEEFGWHYYETNQVETFFTAMSKCFCLSRNNLWEKYAFDKYICLSLPYKHGEFDRFLIGADVEKTAIDADVRRLDEYIKSKKQI